MPCEKAKTYRNERAALDYFNDPRLLIVSCDYRISFVSRLKHFLGLFDPEALGSIYHSSQRNIRKELPLSKS
jgi:hypothetical protein